MQVQLAKLVHLQTGDEIANNLVGPLDILVALRELEVRQISIVRRSDDLVFVRGYQQHRSTVRIVPDGVEPDLEEMQRVHLVLLAARLAIGIQQPLQVEHDGVNRRATSGGIYAVHSDEYLLNPLCAQSDKE